MRTDLGGEQAGKAGLAAARRALQEERRQVAARDAAAQRSAIADQVVLTDELVQVARSHPRGQGLPLRRRLEEGFRASTGQPAHG
ncbi:MAG: hypothetical protein ACXW4H_05070 [Candidatus Limnocylindrales bacterium]